MEKLTALAKKYNVTFRTEEAAPERKSGIVNVYMDVTSFVTPLPPCVLKVEVALEELYPEYDLDENGELLEDELPFLEAEIERILSANPNPSPAFFADAKNVIITLDGGSQILAWNSEWGGVEFS